LPERQRDVVALHYYSRLSLHAIGRRMNVSPQRVSQLHLTALARLRTMLAAR
jgi:RNA polymerase sigma factor (sigma-70 family)